MDSLKYFSFADVWSPYFLIFILAVATLYSFIVGPWRTKFAGAEAVPFVRQAGFYLALLLIYIVHGGPLSLLGHLMFSYHMTDMAISYVMVPPMLLFGIPAWLWRSILSRSFLKPLRILGNPLVGLFAFNLLFSFYHLPNIHDWIMVHYFYHALYYVILLLAAMLNWWHIQCPVQEWARLSPLMRLGYIFLNGLLLTPACVLIIFAGEPLFGVYSDPDVWAKAMGYCVSGNTAELLAKFQGPQFFGSLSAQEDQQLGGIIMKLLQEFINIWALYTVFMQWFRKERKQDEDEGLDPAAAARLNNV